MDHIRFSVCHSRAMFYLLCIRTSTAYVSDYELIIKGTKLYMSSYIPNHNHNLWYILHYNTFKNVNEVIWNMKWGFEEGEPYFGKKYYSALLYNKHFLYVSSLWFVTWAVCLHLYVLLAIYEHIKDSVPLSDIRRFYSKAIPTLLLEIVSWLKHWHRWHSKVLLGILNN